MTLNSKQISQESTLSTTSFIQTFGSNLFTNHCMDDKELLDIGLEMIEVVFDHTTILADPAVEEVAAQLQTILDTYLDSVSAENHS